jgi:hypothetical protein
MESTPEWQEWARTKDACVRRMTAEANIAHTGTPPAVSPLPVGWDATPRASSTDCRMVGNVLVCGGS